MVKEIAQIGQGGDSSTVLIVEEIFLLYISIKAKCTKCLLTIDLKKLIEMGITLNSEFNPHI
jgi:hypothetical protein